MNVSASSLLLTSHSRKQAHQRRRSWESGEERSTGRKTPCLRDSLLPSLSLSRCVGVRQEDRERKRAARESEMRDVLGTKSKLLALFAFFGRDSPVLLFAFVCRADLSCHCFMQTATASAAVAANSLFRYHLLCLSFSVVYQCH